MNENEVIVGDNPDLGVRIEANELISELTNRVSQLTLDGIMKDMIIRKLEEQTKNSKNDDGA